MKRIAWAAAVLAAMTFGPVARAEHEEHGGGGGGWVAKAAKPLGLTAEQQAKLKAIEADRAKTQGPLWQQLKVQMDELKLLVDKKAPDADLTAKLNQLKATRDQLEAGRKAFEAQVAAVLTPTQQAKVALWMGHEAGKQMKGLGHEWHDRNGKEHEHDGEGEHEHGGDE